MAGELGELRVDTSQETGTAPGSAAPSGGRTDVGYWRKAASIVAHDWLAMLGLALVVLMVAAAIIGPALAPHAPAEQLSGGLTQGGQPLGPSSEFPLGTDALGRDELSRLLYGARASLAVGLLGNILAAVVGLVLGGVAGISGRVGEMLFMRVADIILSFPILLLAMTLLALTKPSLTIIVAIVGVSFGAYLSRLVFAQIVSLRSRDFVVAARAAGVRTPTILLRHLLPHVLPTILVYAALGVATGIQLEAALSYVGIGIQPPNASWGNMISDGQSYLSLEPRLVLLPGICIMLAMFGFSLFGDGLRDALDPTLEYRLAPSIRRRR